MTLEYRMTFAGVPFALDMAKTFHYTPNTTEKEDPQSKNHPLKKLQSNDDLIDELNRMIPFQYLQDFSIPSAYPGRNLGAIASLSELGPYPNPSIKIGDWYYPTGACRWGVFRGLAVSSQVKRMVSLTQGNVPRPFIMQAFPANPNMGREDLSQYTVTTNMYMLPPRPLGEVAGDFDGLYLVTLVDERYYFQNNPVSLHINQYTTWTDLITQLSTALNVSIILSSVDSSYQQPESDSQFWTNWESAPILLDAIAANIGRTVVRMMDGTYQLLTPLESAAVARANRRPASNSVVFRTAGGEMFTSGLNLPVGSLQAMRNSVVPSTVNVTFPKYVQGDDPVPHFLNSRYAPQRPTCWYEESYGEVYAVSVPITSGGSQVSGLTGNSNLTLHCTAKALYDTEISASGNPLNVSGLTALSMRLAQDYYEQHGILAYDEVYPGCRNITPEGIHDILWEYSAKKRQVSTRVLKGPWTSVVTDFQHSTPVVSGGTNIPRGVGGPSVAQTHRDGFGQSGYPIEAALAVNFSSGSMTAVVDSVDYFPTQNRWKGLVNNERVLFEGTSGGLGSPGAYAINVVYRCIDNTRMATHMAGSLVQLLAPNTTYGTNLVTYEKMQFAFPQEHTSGGIQGVNVIPQTQTVRVLSASGFLMNSIMHYSGFVFSYNPQLQSGYQYVSGGNCWIVERSAQSVISGAMYDGQIVGYSMTPASPIFAIDEQQLVEIIRLTGLENNGNLEDSYIQVWDPLSMQWVDDKQVWGLDSNAE